MNLRGLGLLRVVALPVLAVSLSIGAASSSVPFEAWRPPVPVEHGARPVKRPEGPAGELRPLVAVPLGLPVVARLPVPLGVPAAAPLGLPAFMGVPLTGLTGLTGVAVRRAPAVGTSRRTGGGAGTPPGAPAAARRFRRSRRSRPSWALRWWTGAPSGPDRAPPPLLAT